MATLGKLLFGEGYLASTNQSRKLMKMLNSFSKYYTFEMVKDPGFGGINVYEKRSGKLIGSYPDMDEIFQQGLNR